MENSVEHREPEGLNEIRKAAPAAGAPARAEWRETRLPAVDIVSDESEVCLIMDLPGVREGGAEVSVDKSVLSVRAAPAARKRPELRLIHAECGEGEYRRSFSLPDDVDRDNIAAALKDGVLRIRLPRLRPCAKRISVSVG